MRKQIVTLLAIFLLLPVKTFPQPVSTLDSLKSQVEELKKSQDKQFKEMVNDEVVKQSREYLTRWWSIIGIVGTIVLTVAGYFGYKFTGSWLKDYIEKQVAEAMAKEFDRLSQKQNKFILEMKMENLKDKYSKNSYDFKESGKEIRELMEEAEKTYDKEFSGRILSEAIIILYNQFNYKTITDLVNKYEKDFPINETSWTNVAIANMVMYVTYGSKAYKATALESCNKALMVDPAYGEPQAVKLIIHVFDYIETQYPEQKKIAVDSLKSVLDELNSGSASTSAYEAYNYFSRLGEFYDKFKNELGNLFPDEMKELKKRHDDYLVSLGKTKSETTT